MILTLEALQSTRRTGEENFSHNNQASSHPLLDLWRWSVPDILSNVIRGRLAEFIVATAININITQVRDEWGAYDH